MKKAIGYVRISTKDQSNFSMEGQEKYIREYAQRHSFEVVAIFKDEGRSAKSFDRPDWKHLEYFIERYSGKISVLIVAKYDRFSRNAAEGLQKIELLERKYKIIIASVFEEMYIDYDSPFFFKQRADMLVNAEFELHVIRDRTKFGNHQARSSGRFITKAPWGYVNARDEKNKPVIVLDPEKVAVIRMVYNFYLAGTAIKQIATEAREHGFSRRGHSAIRNMLSNCVYAGLISVPAYRKDPAKHVKGIHEGVIEEHNWWKVQRLLGNIARPRTIANAEVPLRGELLCFCANPFTAGNSRGKSGKYYWYYKCSTHPKINLSAIKLHSQFDEVLENLSLPETFTTYLQEKAAEILTTQLEERNGKIEVLRAELQQVEKNLDSAEEKFISGTLGQEAFTKWDSKYSGQAASLRHRLSDLEVITSAKWDLFKRNLHKLTDLKGIWHAATLIQKHIFLRQVFNYSLSYSEGAYRTPYLHPLFTHNALILNEKGLLFYEQPVRNGVESDLCTPNGNIIELSTSFLTFLNDIQSDNSIAV